MPGHYNWSGSDDSFPLYYRTLKLWNPIGQKVCSVCVNSTMKGVLGVSALSLVPFMLSVFLGK